MRSRHILQSIQCFLRLTFLIDTHDGVQDDDQQNQSRLEQLTPIFFDADHGKGNDGGCDQNQDHHILKLIQKTLERCLFLLFTELVLTILLTAY